MKTSLESLKTMNKEEVHNYIRKRLKLKGVDGHLRHVDSDLFLDKEHKRFDMSGYDESEKGECVKHNLSILNLFAYLGIYDFTSYLFLDFYKGTPTIYLKYFYEDENMEYDYGGYTTTEIIYEVFLKTIFSNKKERRRIN
ncbi:MAG: hypothetical protein K9I82_02085 [Chitinophagaceae bacterium]|nr:hypothetical protein [Chitinophagaceae bacterium]